MPIHLSLKDYVLIGKERIKGGLNMFDTEMENSTTVKTRVEALKKKGEQYRVRSYSGAGNLNKLRSDIAKLVQTGQIPANDARWFAPGTDLMHLMGYVCSQDSKVLLIFKKGLKEQKVFVAGGNPVKSLPTNGLKRIEIADSQGSHDVIWERWTWT
jgi:hypothetical protein